MPISDFPHIKTIIEQNIFRKSFLLFLIGYFQTITHTLQIKIGELMPNIFQKSGITAILYFINERQATKFINTVFAG